MGLSYRWVIVGAGALMTCVGIGAMFSLAVYLQPMSAETGWSRAGISSATIDFLTMGVAGFAWGAASDRFGTRPVVLSGAALLGSGLILAALSIVFGTAYGGVMPLYAELAREYFGPRIMGTVFGALTMVSSLGMAFGPWAGGMIFDSFNSYHWLYIGSLSVGFGAMAIALAFPPLPSRSRERLQPA